MGLLFRPRRPVIQLAPRADATAELERLAELHQSGALNDAEFAAAKSRALGLTPDAPRKIS
jgi:hypothetical protein